MTQENKVELTPDELAMLDKYVEYGLQNYFETITAKKSPQGNKYNRS